MTNIDVQTQSCQANFKNIPNYHMVFWKFNGKYFDILSSTYLLSNRLSASLVPLFLFSGDVGLSALWSHSVILPHLASVEQNSGVRYFLGRFDRVVCRYIPVSVYDVLNARSFVNMRHAGIDSLIPEGVCISVCSRSIGCISSVSTLSPYLSMGLFDALLH